MAQNKDLVADAQTLLEENLSENKSVESARRLQFLLFDVVFYSISYDNETDDTQSCFVSL